jgi:hypothetical protein
MNSLYILPVNVLVSGGVIASSSRYPAASYTVGSIVRFGIGHIARYMAKVRVTGINLEGYSELNEVWV